MKGIDMRENSKQLLDVGHFITVILIRNLFDKQRDNFNSYAKIDREDMDALKRLGRMAAEGIIKDDDPVWK